MRWTDWLQLLLTIILAVCCLAPTLGNFRREKRNMQILMPITAFLYGMAGIIWIDRIASGLIGITECLAEWFPSVWKFPLALCLSYLTCMAVFLLYIPFKLVIRYPLAWLVKKIPSGLYERTVGQIYQQSSEGIATLRTEYEGIGNLFRFLYGGTLSVGVILFSISVRYPYLPPFHTPLYPIISVLILAEISNFLSGQRQEEHTEESQANDEQASMGKNNLLLREIYPKLFPQHFLCETLQDQGYSDITTSRLISELCQSGNPEKRTLGLYFNALIEEGYQLAEGRIRSVEALLDGKNILYADPFYEDLTPYLAVLAIRILVRGGKILLLPGRAEGCEAAAKWMQESLDQMGGVPNLWHVGMLGKPGLDVGVLSPDELYHQKYLTENQSFLSQTQFLFLIEPSRLVATGQLGLRMLLQRCDPQIVCAGCDRNQDGLLDALSHILEASITEVVSTETPASTIVNMYWDADRQPLVGPEERILTNVARYLGFGTELAAVAMKNGVRQIEWIGAEKAPLRDLKWLIGQYHTAICSYAGISSTQQTVENILEIMPVLWSRKKSESLFAIIEDEFDNLFEISRQYGTRAEKWAFLHILSGQYLLRDYMCANRQILSSDPKAFPSISADYAETLRNKVVYLVIKLGEGPLREDQLIRILGGTQTENPNLLDRLSDLLGQYFSMERYPGAILCETRRELSDDGTHIDSVCYYSLADTTFCRDIAGQFRCGYYVTEKRADRIESVGGRLFCHIYQSFLPGQRHTFSGKYYEIRSIDREHGMLVQRAADHFSQRKSYRQLRRYQISGFCAEDGIGTERQISGIGVIRGNADIIVQTDGYLELSSYEDLKNARKISIKRLPEREYRKKTLLCLKFPEIQAEQRLTITMLFQELFRTAFPDTRDFLAVVTNCGEIQAIPDGLLYKLEGGEPEAIYFIEDSLIDLGLTISIERNLLRFLEQITDYLTWHSHQYGNKPEGAGTDFCTSDRRDYLRFGGEGYPVGICPEQTLTYLVGLGFGKSQIRQERERCSSPAGHSSADSDPSCSESDTQPDDPDATAFEDGNSDQ